MPSPPQLPHQLGIGPPSYERPPIVIAGPTGTGKSELATRLARVVDGEIVNYDSVQIYRGFDIGSAKPSQEARVGVPHHLFDIIDAHEEFNASDYAAAARECLADLDRRGRRAILVGGTFFYLRALLSGLPSMPGRSPALRERLEAIASHPRGPERLHRWLSRVDPVSGARLAPGDRQRVERALEVWLSGGKPISTWERPTADTIPAVRIGLAVPRTELVARLDARVTDMFARGLIEETRALLARFPADSRPFGTIGYREAVAHLCGQLSRDEAIAETQRRTRGYAKRQMTWLRSERNVQWIDAANPETTFAAARRLLEEQT